ncbi:preprotein translocase subunit SecA [Patescibacteria group bacterium]|nr:preprotein translocase subunit SecA [Patescibacteria group bacterium]MBU1721778.1 preprotein translocase subunit SecA [Patescibacteria group bacterium]MBU1901383.1 preprotein translocase subunit SecA [Patescibacteria group bacterium]
MNVLKKTYEKVFGNFNIQTMKEIQPIVEKINSFESAYAALSDKELQGKTAEFKAALKEGKTLDDILPEAFATVREVGKRTLGMRHYDVQMVGGIALHRGMIAEMRTGEGKTLVATLPTYLNALEGKGVHVITVNDYLAKRDAVWMGQVYDFLGISLGIVQGQRVSFIYDAQGDDVTDAEQLKEHSAIDSLRDKDGSFKVESSYLRGCTRQEAYLCDITYGTNNEFGFDYLRDNMVQDQKDMVMRAGSEMHYAVIDEIDSILIDEARTPLIISAQAGEATDQYYTFAKLVRNLNEETDYNVDEKLRSATLTEEGITVLEKALGIENIYAEGGIRVIHHIEQALRSEVLFTRDKDYVLDGEEVVIIDEFTGRKMPGRRYSEGLHQAIEAKEGVAIKQESRTLATITFQNLFRMYTKLSGMTGTAVTEEEEFRSIYGLDVLVIPTNKPDARKDYPDRIYKTEKGKYKAIVEKIKECREKNQPILVGTISVEKNEELGLFLQAQGIPHEILNAKNHEREGEIVAKAGMPGAVTLATNMAGRGVDIKLGGPDASEEDRHRVLASGGLFVLGTERHESRRIDNQLRGRSARQGDPGETQFFVSTHDDLMRIFAGDRLRSVMDRLKVPEDMPIEQGMISKMLENAQKKVESHHYDIRKHLLEYDDILNKQRQVIYTKRREILDIAHAQEAGDEIKKSLRDVLFEFIEQEIEFIISFHTNGQILEGEEGHSDDWNTKEIFETMNTIFPCDQADKKALKDLVAKRGQAKVEEVVVRDEIVQYFLTKAQVAYDALEVQVAEKVQDGTQAKHMMAVIEKQVILRAIDSLWVDHLVQMTYLRTGIGLQGYGQRDPLIEYKKESFGLFTHLQSSIQKEIVYAFFKVGVGLQLAPTVMADDKLVFTGAKKTSDSAALARGGAGVSTKQKMSKKDRRRLNRQQKG